MTAAAGGPWSWVLMIILALAVGISTLMMLNRRYGGKSGPRREVENLDQREVFARAVVRREPAVLEKIDAREYAAADLAPDLRPVVAALHYHASSLRIEDGSGKVMQADLRAGGTSLAVIAPQLAANWPEMVFTREKGRVVLEIVSRNRISVELDNPAFSYKLRLFPGQAVVLCPGDLLLEGAGPGRLKFAPLGAREPEPGTVTA